MKCSYCQTEMQITTVQKKRSVPPGAKDLGLTDAVTCWQCSQCGLTATLILERCKCGAITGPDGVSDRATKLPISEKDYGCTNCIVCWICKESLCSAPYLVEKSTRKVNEYKYEHDGYAGYVDNIYINYSYHHQECWEQFQRRKREIAVKEELKQIERRKRIAACLCVECGKPLGLLDKLAGRHLHTSCS